MSTQYTTTYQPLTEEQVCQILHCSPTTLYRLRKAGKIKYCRTGRSPVYLPQHVNEYLEKNARDDK